MAETERLVGKVSVADLCDKHGMHLNVFWRWQKEFFENGASAFEAQNDGKRGLARNSSASLAFSGKGIRLYSMTDPTLGQMKVWVDRRKAVTVNLKAPTASAVPVFEVTGLGSGRHTLNVKAAGKGHIFVNAAEVIR